MSKVILSTLVAAFVCAASAKAENSISTKSLSEMGLSGISLMSDNAALAVRGKGFLDCDSCARTEPRTAVVGQSLATMNLANCPDCVAIDGGSHSENGYIAAGPYYSAGSNYSEAGAILVSIESVDVNGVITSLTKSTSAKVFAGGNSSARAF
jgi:hypothetical protein